MKRRNGRQEAIRWIVRNKSIRTQKDLVEELKARGYTCTQATASRDIADMGLRKLPEGIYVLAEDLHLQRMVSEFVTDVESVNNLVVIKTQPGTAPGVAAAVQKIAGLKKGARILDAGCGPGNCRAVFYAGRMV